MANTITKAVLKGVITNTGFITGNIDSSSHLLGAVGVLGEATKHEPQIVFGIGETFFIRPITTVLIANKEDN